MATRIEPGKYQARAVSWDFGVTSTGKDQIGILFEVQGGSESVRLPWYGFFHDESAAKRSMSSMRACGWNGEGPVTDAQGLDEKDVQVVVEDDDYNGETRSRIAWVNSLGVAMAKPLDDTRKAALNERLAKWQKPAANGTKSVPRKPPPPKSSGAFDNHEPPEGFDDGSDVPF
jgi:hypothetical protein